MSTINEELIEWLGPQGYSNFRDIPGQGLCATMRLMFTYGLFVGITKEGYKGYYHYPFHTDCIDAITDWNGDGDPPGYWLKYKGEGGERSNPLIKK